MDPKKNRCKVRLGSGELRNVPISSVQPLPPSSTNGQSGSAAARASSAPVSSSPPFLGFDAEELFSADGVASSSLVYTDGRMAWRQPPLCSTQRLKHRGWITPKVGEPAPCELLPLVHSGMLRAEFPEAPARRVLAQICSAAPQARQETKSRVRTGLNVLMPLPDAEFSAVLVTLCETLAGHLVGEQSGCHCEVDDVWGVVQRAGEYRPLRSHRNRKSPVGFSCLMDLQLPPSLSPDNHERPSKGAYGFHDGLHNLIWKADRSNDRLELIHPGIVQCELLTGYVYIFPQWLQQLTYPFSGEGERIWVAANVALFTPTQPEHP